MAHVRLVGDQIMGCLKHIIKPFKEWDEVLLSVAEFLSSTLSDRCYHHFLVILIDG